MVVELSRLVFCPEPGRLCQLPYPDHKSGCPNYGRKAGCPPGCARFTDRMDTSRPVYAVINDFDFEGHILRMRLLHPKWSDRQLRCCLYWQGMARSRLRIKVVAFLLEHPEYIADLCPEAGGVNVTQTLRLHGIILEWPPSKIVRQVALAGVPRR